MAYCALSDIEHQLPEDDLVALTDDAGSDEVDTDVVDRAIADADEEIDAYLALRYSLPFSTTPELIRKFSVDLAICNLYARRAHLNIPETRKDKCSRARRMLEKIAAGGMRIDVPEPAKTSTGGIAVTTSKADRAFSIGRRSDGSAGTLDNY